MSDNKNHIEHISLQELQEYLSGVLSGKEANKIEQHLENCRLCSDALEGLEGESPDVFAEEVEQLRTMVQGKSASRSGLGWTWRIAAGVILIAASTFFIINFLNTSTPTQELEFPKIAASEDSVIKEPKAMVTKDSTADSSFAIQKPPLAQAEQVTKEIQEVNEAESQSGEGIAETGDLEIAEVQDEGVEDIFTEPALEEKTITLATKPEEKIEEEKPVSVAEEGIAMNKETQDVAKSKRARTLSEPPARAAQPEAFDAESVTALPSISVLPLTGEETFERNAEPIDGIDEFIKAIQIDLAYPKEAAAAGIMGTVRLRFQVGADGALSLFEIIDSLGYGCDEETIRVIKEGPGWKPAIKNSNNINQKVEVLIPFPASNR